MIGHLKTCKVSNHRKPCVDINSLGSRASVVVTGSFEIEKHLGV